MAPEAVTRNKQPSDACPHCDRVFSRKDSLIRHLKTHGSDVQRGPLHRIVNQRFRACAPCRRSKVRCPGSMPCARCEQLHVDCIYEGSSRRAQSVSSILTSNSLERTKAEPSYESTMPPFPSPQSSRPTYEDFRRSASPSIQNEVGPMMPEPEELDANLDHHVPSPPASSTVLPQTENPSPVDLRTPLPTESNGFSNLNSAFISPTLHILDPYSYKLPSLPDSTGSPQIPPLSSCRYPVLEYLSPFLEVTFSSNLACDLLDTYFSSQFRSRLHPTCHHLHNFIVRKCDVLDPVHPRRMHPALLASMLFVAAISDKALGLFTGPEERDRICKYLSLLTYRLLNPSRHEPLLSHEDLGLMPSYGVSHHGWTNHDLQRALDPQGHHSGSLPITWGTDYIITFIHVASVISGSEKKAASIRWWSAAFSLARDLKLNQEVASYVVHDESGDLKPILNCGCSANPDKTSKDFMTEVHREERRRTWWLLFLMDRHLALCYNRPLALLEAECTDLLFPLDDVIWQSGVQPHSHGQRGEGPRCMLAPVGTGRSHGPPNICTGPGLFESFLPLMTITGHLLDFNRAKNHPVLVSAGSSMFWTSQEHNIIRELDCYQASLNRSLASPQPSTTTPTTSALPINSPTFEANTSPWTITSPSTTTSHPQSTSTSTITPLSTESALISATVHAYASHILSVLRILVGSKWDPISLFEDADFWTSSSTFADSMSHTISASTHVSTILTLDPDICFMPYFFGIQLLHGSLLLLLVAYRLQSDSGAVILDACETVVRATEACFVTLPTDYQRQYRNVMRSAIALAKGRRGREEDGGKQLASVLARYRWSRGGGGLAR